MNKKQALETAKQIRRIVSDYEDECEYWDNETLLKNFKELVKTFKPLIDGQIQMLIKIGKQK